MDINEPDCKQNVPYDGMIGRKFMNNNNHKIYTITAIAFCGDSDEWGYCLMREGSDVVFVRTMNNFFGKNRDGNPRFVYVQDLQIEAF